MADEYDQKLRDMQKYVPFLENLIQNLKKSNKHDEKREAQLNKMQMFYELLTNKNKKLKLETLERCEQVLVKLYQKAEKIKSELPISTDSSPAKLLITPVISTPEKFNEHNYVPQKSTPNTPLLLSPTLAVNPIARSTFAVNPLASSTLAVNSIPNPTLALNPVPSPTLAVNPVPSPTLAVNSVPSLAVNSVASDIPRTPPVASCSVSNVSPNTSDLSAKTSSFVKEFVVQPKTVQESLPPDEDSEQSEDNAVENEPAADNSPPNNEVTSEEEHDDASDCTNENIPMVDSEASENRQPTVDVEPVQELVEMNIASPVSIKETVSEYVDSISPDTNEQTDIPPNVTDDWKSAKRKLDDNPEQGVDVPVTDTAPLENLSQTQEESQEDQTVPMDIEEEEEGNDPVEPESACSSMEIEEDNNHSQMAEEMQPPPLQELDDTRRKSVDTESSVLRPEQTVTSTMKNDPEECSVTSTTATDPRREKATEDESDEQNSMQDTVTDSSSNNEGTAKNWIPGALLNLLNPNTIDKSTVLNMLEKVVEGEKFQQIKAILAAEEESKKSAETEKKIKDEADEKPTITTKAEDVKQEKIEHSDEVKNTSLPVDDKKLIDTKSHTRVRRTELDRLNEDVKFILDTDVEKIGCPTKRACTENKTTNYCEIGPEAPLKAPPKEPVETATPPPKKKKKKKYEVFSYRTRRRSKRKKPTVPAVAALAEAESGADGTESSLGGGDIGEVGDESILEDAPEPVEEAPAVAEEYDEKDAYQPPAPVRISKEDMTEEEKAFKNIHPEMHSLSKYISTCAVCNFSGRYVTTHYMNSHRMSEMVVSRLPPKAQERLMKGQGVDSVFTGKDPFQNRVYQYTCPFCNVKKNYARKIWSQHFGSHTGEYKYKCSGCGYMSVNVRGHIMKYCPGSKPIMLENLDRGQDIVGHICKLCNYIQMNREHVVEHIENQHEITEGSSELITEITLFRSDLTNLNTHSGKKLKLVETAVKAPPPPAPKQSQPAIEPPKAKQSVAAEAEGSSEGDEEGEGEEEVATEGGENETLGSLRPRGKLFIPKPAEGERLKNVYPYIHSQSGYVNRCVLCNYAGKFITKHYVKEHPNDEVFVARIPPDRQARILNNQQLTKLGPVTVVKYKNYYRHSACPFCPVEKSSQRFDWVMHFATHTGEYKFRCTQCNHYGNARNEFARHFKNGCPNGKLVRLWSHYKYNEEDPVNGFLCKICNYIQMSRKNLERHLETEHENAAPNSIQQITLFAGNPRYKGRRSVKGGKKGKRAKRKIKHVSETGVTTFPDFLCEGVVDEEFMAEEESMMDEAQLKEREKRKTVEDDDLVLPMHQISADFSDTGFEHLFQMEMNESGEQAAASAIESEAPKLTQAEKSDKSGEEQELIRPDEDPPQNIHPEMHAMSQYASKCLLCDFGGKYIAKHYTEEHSDFEVFASRLPPEAQRSLLSGEGSQPIKCVIRSRKMNYYFACPFCKLERDCTRHNWVAHFAIHTGEYKYQCSQCSHRGNATRDFKRHFKGNCRFAKQVRQWPDLVSKEEPIMAHYCNLCNYIQLDRGRVVDHLRTQHKCYEQLISKIMLLFIDPKTQMETAINGTDFPAITAAAAVKRKFFKRRLGKHRKKRPISKMWSVSSQKRAWLQRRNQQTDDEAEEEEEEADEEDQDGAGAGADGSDGDFDDGEEEHVAEGGDGDKDTEDVIEIEDSDEEPPPAKDTSTLNSYEKIKRFIEQTEAKAKGAITLTKQTPVIKQEKPSAAPQPRPPPPRQPTLPIEPPTIDRPLSNIHPEMHSQSPFSKKCILCPFVGRHLINHYISFHPRFEVPISRLPPKSQQLLFANKANLAVEVETNPFSPKLFSYTCLFCDTEFTFSIKSWVDHIGTHTGEYNFKCSQCSRMINTKNDILEHIKQYCKKGKALARQFPVTEKQQLLAHICKLCNFIQMNRGNIVQHLRVQHKVQSTTDQITQIMLLQFSKHPARKPDPVPIIPKKDDRIKVENTKYDTRYTTKEFVKVEQSDAIYEILVPETELSVPSDTATTSATIKTERNADKEPGLLMRTRNLTRQSMPGGSGAQTVNSNPTVSAITLRRSVPATAKPSSSQQSTSPVPTAGLEAVKRVSHLGYSYTLAGVTKYHCCVRDCTFSPTTVPISLATHIMDDHPTLLWEGYCRECQGHVATGKNMKLTKEIQHLFEHTRKRPAELPDSKEGLLVPGPPPKLQRRTDLGPQRPGMPGTKGAPGDSPDQIIARFAKNRSITITREVKANEAGTAILPPLTPIPTQNAAVANKQQQVLKEVKRTPLKPWTVSKSVKTENIVGALLSDISLFAFFKCMGNDCQYTTNDSNKMAEHLTLHSERADKDKKSDQPAESNVFSWLECCYCSTWAGTVMQLIAHITAKHSRDIYQCPYCFYRSCEEYNVGIHIKHYHRQLQTSILFCFGRRLLKPGGDLAIHTVKKMKCISCPINFMNPIAFATHVAEYTDVDLGGDIYKCYYCSKKHTKSIIEFARHIVEHRPVRKADSYRCYKCFKDQSQHIPLPNKNNIKAYQCVHCAYSIDDEAQIGLHMAQVHASNLLFCGLRIRSNNASPLKQEDANNRLDNGAAFVLLKKRIDEKLLYRCPYTPTQLNYLDTKIEVLSKTKEEEPADIEMDEGPSASPVITQNPIGLKIAQVQSITSTEFASFITIDDDD